MASIQLTEVNKSYDSGRAVVRDLSIDVADGELLVLVGPSGSGKSTVLRLVAGLESPTSGRIAIGGHDMTAVPPQQRDVAMVFQSYALYPHMTVRQNLGFGLRMRGVSQEEIDQSVAATAAMLGIQALLDRRPAQLSGGQRQRVAVGRALARKARVYLLDEPLSNLDPLLRVETRTELALLHRRLGATMLYVTHDQEEAMTLGTRIGVMCDGRLEQVGAPMELYRRPANRFVASFIGAPSINICRMRCERVDDRVHLTAPMLEAPLDVGDLFGHPGGAAIATSGTTIADATPPHGTGPSSAASRDVGADVDVAFRPQDAALVDAREGDVRGRVEVVESLGSHTLVHLRVDGLDSLLRVVVAPDAGVQVDDRPGLRIRRDALHLFDAVSGRRLH